MAPCLSSSLLHLGLIHYLSKALSQMSKVVSPPQSSSHFPFTLYSTVAFAQSTLRFWMYLFPVTLSSGGQEWVSTDYTCLQMEHTEHYKWGMFSHSSTDYRYENTAIQLLKSGWEMIYKDEQQTFKQWTPGSKVLFLSNKNITSFNNQ